MANMDELQETREKRKGLWVKSKVPVDVVLLVVVPFVVFMLLLMYVIGLLPPRTMTLKVVHVPATPNRFVGAPSRMPVEFSLPELPLIPAPVNDHLVARESYLDAWVMMPQREIEGPAESQESSRQPGNSQTMLGPGTTETARRQSPGQGVAPGLIYSTKPAGIRSGMLTSASVRFLFL
jgi:hypothetical protein